MTTDLPERSNTKATDSPWFWIYLFSTVALIGLLIIQAKFVSRQTAIERKGLGRRIMLEQQADAGAHPEDKSAATNQQLQTVSLRWLILILAAAICLGWIVFWTQQLRKDRGERKSATVTREVSEETGESHCGL